MKQNNNQTSTAVRELNGFLVILLILGCLGSLIQIIIQTSQLVIFEAPGIYIALVVLSYLLGIAINIFILAKKRWAVIAWFVLQMLTPFLVLLMDDGASDFLPGLVRAVIACGIFRLLLMLKKDGISAWDTIMKSDEDFECLWQELHDDESNDDEEPVE